MLWSSGRSLDFRLASGLCYCVGCGVNDEIVPQPLLCFCVGFFFPPLFSPVWGISLVVLGFHPEDIVPSLAVDLVCLMERDEFRSLPCCHCKLELSCIILVKWPEALWAKFYVPRLMFARWRFTENLPKLLPGSFTLRSEVKLNRTVPVLKDVWHGYLKGPAILWNRFANVSLLLIGVYHLLWLWLSWKHPVKIQISYLWLKNRLLWNKLFVYRITLLN